jgi:hypothetical protein
MSSRRLILEPAMPAARTSIRNLNRSLNRNLDRHLNRRCIRSINRRATSGRCARINHLSCALFALGKAIRAGHNLARLAPDVFNMAFVLKNAAQAEQQAALRTELQSALTRVYGSDATPTAVGPVESAHPLARYSRRTNHAIEREMASRELWFTIGRQAWQNFCRLQPHPRLTLGQISRLCSVASRLGRLAIGSDTSRTAARPATLEVPDFRTALHRIYGEPELTTANSSNGAKTV